MRRLKPLAIGIPILAGVLLVIWYWGIHPAYIDYPGSYLSEGLLVLLFSISGLLGLVAFVIWK